MESLIPILLASGLAIVLAVVALREHQALRASRRALFSDCGTLLENGRTVPGTAEFPRLMGHYRGRAIHANLIPDTMTIRRLPQLWPSITLQKKLPIQGGLAALVRPSGNDYFSLTETFSHTLVPPKSLPWEVLVRGETPECQALADEIAESIGCIFADPKVKEVAVTSKGVRIVRQAAEGRRGEHLLLRQAIFNDAHVPREDFERLLSQICNLSALVQSRPSNMRAA